jgi:hypothetical protein
MRYIQIVGIAALCLAALAHNGSGADGPKSLAELKDSVDARAAALNDAERKYVEAKTSGATLAQAGLVPLGWSPADLALKQMTASDVRDTEMEVRQIVDAENMMIRIFDDEDVWVTGVATSGFVDDRTFKVKAAPLVAVCGSHSFTTALGTKRTIRKFCLAQTPTALAVLKDIEVVRRSRSIAGIGDATFVELKNGEAVFDLLGGGSKTTKLISLPKEDADWVRKILAEERKIEVGKKKKRR